MDNQKDNKDIQESIDISKTTEVENEEKKEENIEITGEEQVEEKIQEEEVEKEQVKEKKEDEEVGKEQVKEKKEDEEVGEEQVEEKKEDEEVGEEQVEEKKEDEEVGEEQVEEKKEEEEVEKEQVEKNIDIDDIKLEEIDIEQIKKELELKENNIEKELEQLEKKILQQSDIFETEILIDAIMKDQELLDSIDVKGNNIDEVDNRQIENNTKKEADINVHKKKKTYNKAMSKVLVAVTAVFLCMITYIVYYVMIDSKTRLNNPYNERSLLLEETVIRGKIVSADNEILAQTINEDGKWIRYYPYGSLFAHSVGRYDKGKTGIELGNDFSLVTTKDSTIDKIVNDIKDEKSQGNGIVTTLNYKLQKAAYDALGKKKGAVVAIEPSTGKILAMVSKPTYDPNFVAENWSVLSNTASSNNRLINRATSGLYPPGSTFKIVTTLALIRKGNYDDFSYKCVGSKTFNGYKMRCYNGKRHGNEDLTSAFANSCNGAFGTIGVEVGKTAIMQTASNLLFNKKIDYNYGYSKSRFMLTQKDDDTMLAQTSVGQGNTQITPFHNALIVSAIANGGVLMKPYMVDKIIDGDDNVIEITKEKKMDTLMTNQEASLLTEYMKEVVESGTATSIKNKKYDIAGKTGSAEYNQKGDSHAWFVGFAPAHNPTIAFSIIVEGGGTGSTSAVPIAKKILDAYIK